MATHGALAAFDPTKEEWTCYTDRMKHYFIVNDVTDGGKKRSILLAACGPAAYKIIRNLVDETRTDTMSFEEIVKLVKEHFELAPSAIT